MTIKDMTTKPDGRWKCRACGAIWDGWQLVCDPMSIIAPRWTCANYFCGGRCDRLPEPDAWPTQEGNDA